MKRFNSYNLSEKNTSSSDNKKPDTKHSLYVVRVKLPDGNHRYRKFDTYNQANDYKNSQKKKNFSASIEVVNRQLEKDKKQRANSSAEKIKKDADQKKAFDKKRKVVAKEDAPANNVGGGKVAGIAPGEAPPVRMKKKDRLKAYRTAMLNRRSSGALNSPPN